MYYNVIRWAHQSFLSAVNKNTLLETVMHLTTTIIFSQVVDMCCVYCAHMFQFKYVDFDLGYLINIFHFIYEKLILIIE